MNSLKYGLYWALLIFAVSCKKNEAVTAGQRYQLSYGESVFYLRNQSADVLVAPLNPKAGIFTSFPDGLSIDTNTGIINVSQSDAGMRYRIQYHGSGGDSATTFIVISGINFPDKFYRLESADSVAFPVYNADPSRTLPGGNFDEDHVANNSGCAIRTNNGQINLTESIRKGLFGNTPQNDTRKDFEVRYRLDDPSGKALNKIKILIYYYDRMQNVPSDLLQTIQDHQAMTFQPDNQPVNTAPLTTLARKPRPPCIVIIGHNN